MSTTRIICEKCGLVQAYCKCGTNLLKDVPTYTSDGTSYKKDDPTTNEVIEENCSTCIHIKKCAWLSMTGIIKVKLQCSSYKFNGLPHD